MNILQIHAIKTSSVIITEYRAKVSFPEYQWSPIVDFHVEEGILTSFKFSLSEDRLFYNNLKAGCQQLVHQSLMDPQNIPPAAQIPDND